MRLLWSTHRLGFGSSCQVPGRRRDEKEATSPPPSGACRISFLLLHPPRGAPEPDPLVPRRRSQHGFPAPLLPPAPPPALVPALRRPRQRVDRVLVGPLHRLEAPPRLGVEEDEGSARGGGDDVPGAKGEVRHRRQERVHVRRLWNRGAAGQTHASGREHKCPQAEAHRQCKSVQHSREMDGFADLRTMWATHFGWWNLSFWCSTNPSPRSQTRIPSLAAQRDRSAGADQGDLRIGQGAGDGVAGRQEGEPRPHFAAVASFLPHGLNPRHAAAGWEISRAFSAPCAERQQRGCRQRRSGWENHSGVAARREDRRQPRLQGAGAVPAAAVVEHPQLHDGREGCAGEEAPVGPQRLRNGRWGLLRVIARVRAEARRVQARPPSLRSAAAWESSWRMQGGHAPPCDSSAGPCRASTRGRRWRR